MGILKVMPQLNGITNMQLLIKLMFFANILVAGWISLTSMINPEKARLTIFEGTIQYSESIRLVGCLWFAIFILSIAGLFVPDKMNLVFLFQLIYKGTWLVIAALPSLINGSDYPRGMASFFLAWVLLLPFVIDWQGIFGKI